MSLATRWAGGFLSPPDRRQWMKSTKRGIHCLARATKRSDRIEFAGSPTFQILRRSLSASSADAHESRQLPISSLARVAAVQVRCSAQLECQPTSDDAGGGIKSDLRTRGLFRIAALIGSATVVSKLLGLVRETVLAAVFGVGPVITAYSYSSVIPGFFLTLLGGINGPVHSAAAVSLSKRSRDEGTYLLQRLTIIIGTVSGAMSIAIFVLAAPLVDTIAPGLMIPGNFEGLLTRKLAIIQLKIMAPCAMLAALTGIGFGALSAAGVYGVPSLSPALSSISVLIVVSTYALQLPQSKPSPSDAIAAAVCLATGATFGAFAQWGLQALARHRAGFGSLKVSGGQWRNPFEDDGVQEVFAVLLPATIASGMLQIATYTDLYFASFIPGAAAALGYANLLAMAPVGILSSSILVPLLPTFARLSKASNKVELQKRVRQGLLLSMALTVLLTALMVSLAGPIVRIVFERGAFETSASVLVSSLLVFYVLGSTFYVARDLLVQVFYALGDGRTPFQISTAAIFANAVLDWLLVRYVGCGVQGLVLATCLVNCGSTIALVAKLSSKLEGLRLQHWIRSLLLLGSNATVAGIFTKYSYDQLSVHFFSAAGSVDIRYQWATDLLSVLLASVIGVISYIIPLLLFQVSEMNTVFQLLQARL